jgi:hypothetical protein
MNRVFSIILIAAVFCVLGGCVAIVKTENPSCWGLGKPMPPMPASAAPDIDLAKNAITTEQGKIDAYQTIASRPNLSPADRTCLVEAVKAESKLTAEQKDEIILMILNNPAPAPQPISPPPAHAPAPAPPVTTVK